MLVQCLFRFIQYERLVFSRGLYRQVASTFHGWLKRILALIIPPVIRSRSASLCRQGATSC